MHKEEYVALLDIRKSKLHPKYVHIIDKVSTLLVKNYNNVLILYISLYSVIKNLHQI